MQAGGVSRHARAREGQVGQLVPPVSVSRHARACEIQVEKLFPPEFGLRHARAREVPPGMGGCQSATPLQLSADVQSLAAQK